MAGHLGTLYLGCTKIPFSLNETKCSAETILFIHGRHSKTLLPSRESFIIEGTIYYSSFQMPANGQPYKQEFLRIEVLGLLF